MRCHYFLWEIFIRDSNDIDLGSICFGIKAIL